MKQRVFTLVVLSLSIWGATAQSQTGKPVRPGFSRSARIRYNRVEGLFAGYRLGVTPKTWQGLSLFAEGGYGVHNREPRWEGGVEYQNPKGAFSLSLFDRTETNDREIISTRENTIFALLLKWDYQDYFRAKNGFEAKGSYRPRRPFHLLGRLKAFTYAEMPAEAQWSLFYPDRAFRVNPRIQPGDAGLLQIGFLLDTRMRTPLFRNAWYVTGIYERGFREFEYNGLILAAKRFQKLIFGQQAFVLQARLATRESTHEQHLFDLGGVGTLRGYEIKEFTGNRMVMINFDYLFRGDFLGRIPIKGFHLLNLILFFDAGWVHSEPRSESLLGGFQDLDLKDFKPNAGISIAAPQQFLRFNVARRLDRSNDPWVLSMRVRRKF